MFSPSDVNARLEGSGFPKKHISFPCPMGVSAVCHLVHGPGQTLPKRAGCWAGGAVPRPQGCRAVVWLGGWGCPGVGPNRFLGLARSKGEQHLKNQTLLTRRSRKKSFPPQQTIFRFPFGKRCSKRKILKFCHHLQPTSHSFAHSQTKIF